MPLFFRVARPIMISMIDDFARIDRGDPPHVLMSEGGPWGAGSDGDAPKPGKAPEPAKAEEPAKADDPAEDAGNPWTRPPRTKPKRAKAPGQPSIEDFIRRGRERFGGGFSGGGGFGGHTRPVWGYAFAAFVLLWLATTSVHRIDPQERGVVTRFGRYVETLKPGIGLTLPAPMDVVTRVNVDQIRNFDVPTSGGQNLVLTGDQNIIDLAYSVRWSIRDPELYLFELAEPEDTIKEVAESAMREEIARVTLDEAIGPMRSQIESRVATRMQALLDTYHAGVTVEGVAIKQADPPPAVNDAFKAVSAAQQDAQSDINKAKSYAQQVEANAQASAAAFDKVYDAYKLAPEVTRRRMYYETMEAVLSKTDKVIVDTPGAGPYFPLPLPQGKHGASPAPVTVTIPPADAAPATGGGE
ncbi:MAG: HflK protein [Sphingomonas bacterium]|jgi:membrane protease subunit HflK|nr:HflK protein [Sphingomonas bacterium]